MRQHFPAFGVKGFMSVSSAMYPVSYMDITLVAASCKLLSM